MRIRVAGFVRNREVGLQQNIPGSDRRGLITVEVIWLRLAASSYFYWKQLYTHNDIFRNRFRLTFLLFNIFRIHNHYIIFIEDSC